MCRTGVPSRFVSTKSQAHVRLPWSWRCALACGLFTSHRTGHHTYLSLCGCAGVSAHDIEYRYHTAGAAVARRTPYNMPLRATVHALQWLTRVCGNHGMRTVRRWPRVPTKMLAHRIGVVSPECRWASRTARDFILVWWHEGLPLDKGGQASDNIWLAIVALESVQRHVLTRWRRTAHEYILSAEQHCVGPEMPLICPKGCSGQYKGCARQRISPGQPPSLDRAGVLCSERKELRETVHPALPCPLDRVTQRVHDTCVREGGDDVWEELA